MSFRPFFPQNSFRSTTRTLVRGLSTAAFVALLGFSAAAQAQKTVPNASVFSQNRPIPQRVPQNAPPKAPENSTQIPETPQIPQRASRQASDATAIWSNFLFGSSANAQTARRRSPMKFAFSPESATKNQIARPTSNNRRAKGLTRQNSNGAPNLDARSQAFASTQTPTPETTAEARRRRLQELNALLAARRPDEYARRLAGSTSADQTPQLAQNRRLNDAESPSSAVASSVRLAQLRRVGADVGAPNRFAENADASVPFDAARANRSKIRQASGLVPSGELVALPTVAELPIDAESAPVDEFADDALGFAFLPIRPNALRIAPQIFLSSELVPLPNAAALEPEPTSETKTPPRPAARPLESAQRPELPAERETPRQVVGADAFAAPQISGASDVSAAASKSVAPPTFASPAKSSDSVQATNSAVSDEKFPLHRPASPFVDSRTVPDKT